MVRGLFVGLFLLAGPCLGEERKNVLFLVADDLNTRLNCYGFRHIHSPHVDELARTGVRFHRAYCQYPSCGPSRASVLTGLRPDTTRVLHNRYHFRDFLPSVVTLPQFFRERGYFVARVGKIYHQANPTHIGTSGPDDPASWELVVNPRGRDKDEEDQLTVYTPFLPLPDQMSYLRAAGEDEEQTDGKVAQETIRLLEKHRDEPFFLAAGFYRPHIPYIAPRRYFEFYSLEKTLLPEIPKDYRERVPAAALASTPRWPNFDTTPRQARECILAYDACVSFVDAQVGRILEALDRLQLRERTIVVLWGDHGYHLGEHGLWRKNSLFEESMRAPLLIRAPGVSTAGGVCESPVELVDLYPTLVDLAGWDPPESLEGVSLRPLLQDPSAPRERPAYSQVHFREVAGRAVRTKRWRYVEWGEAGSKGKELYDQNLDPREWDNLAGNPDYGSEEAELRALLRAQFPETGE